MTHPLCLLRTLVGSMRTLLRTGYPISGHRYVEEFNGPAYVSVLKCECCGRYSVGWSKSPQ